MEAQNNHPSPQTDFVPTHLPDVNGIKDEKTVEIEKDKQSLLERLRHSDKPFLATSDAHGPG